MKKECENCGKFFEAIRRQKYCGSIKDAESCKSQVKREQTREYWRKNSTNNYRKVGKQHNPYKREFSADEEAARDNGFF